MRRLPAVLIALTIAISVTGCAKPPTARQILKNAAAAHQKVKTLKVEAENSGEFRVGNEWQSKGQLVLTQFKRPDKFRQQTVGDKMPGVISNGKSAYGYSGQGNTFIQIPPQQVVNDFTRNRASVQGLRLALDKKPFANIKGVKLIGEERLGELNTYVVEYALGDGFRLRGMEKANMTERLWVDKETWLVRKGALTARQKADKKTGARASTLTITNLVCKMETDPKIPDKEFDLPKGASVMQMPGAPPAP